MITVKRALGHMAWADRKMFDEIAAMPAGALDAVIGPRRVSDLLMHIVSGAEWYRFLLGGGKWTELSPPANVTELMIMRDHLGRVNDFIIASLDHPDEVIEFRDENGPARAMRSTILSQAAYHSAEHRTQIACALEVSGLPTLDLDTYDLWAYEAAGN